MALEVARWAADLRVPTARRHLRDQLVRAADSVVLSIAEGCGRPQGGAARRNSRASRKGRMREALVRYVKPHVLVVDEVGYIAYSDDAANVLFHVIKERHVKRRASLFTTNKHPRRWGAVLHDDDLAETIVDRILERGRLLRLDGPSLLPDTSLQTTPSTSAATSTNGAELPEQTAQNLRNPTEARTATGESDVWGRS